MARLFHRQYAPAPWNPNALAGPMVGLTLREWEVNVVLCSQATHIKQALCAWLIAPTAPTWPHPDEFSPHLLPFTQSDLRPSVEPLHSRLWEVVKALRQTLDAPFESFGGIARDVLLVAHGTRLRQVIAALGEPLALEEIARMQRLSRWMPPKPAAVLLTRWGGRWAAYFSGPPPSRPASGTAGGNNSD